MSWRTPSPTRLDYVPDPERPIIRKKRETQQSTTGAYVLVDKSRGPEREHLLTWYGRKVRVFSTYAEALNVAATHDGLFGTKYWPIPATSEQAQRLMR